MGLYCCKKAEPKPQKALFVRYSPTSVIEQMDSTSVFAVVDIPAGTMKLQYSDTSGHLQRVSDQPIDFLPFPGNYGFIAGCSRYDSINRVYRPLPVLAMMTALEAGSVVEVQPIAVLVLKYHQEPYPVVIAVPSDTSLQALHVTGFVDFLTEYDAVRHIIEQWFLNYQGRETFGFTGWQDEFYARQLIADWKSTE